MQTRVGRNGREQVHLGLWIDQGVYDKLVRLARNKATTISELTRTLLENSVEAETHRPDAEEIVQSLLNLSEAEREQLRQQIGTGKKGTVSSRNKQRQIAALRGQNAKVTSATEPMPDPKLKSP
jgi:hypothetical protein